MNQEALKTWLATNKNTLKECKTLGDNWISVEYNQFPTCKFDFRTLLQTQYISRPLVLRLNVKEDNCEYEGFAIILNGKRMWSLDECGTSAYIPLEYATHWRYL